MLGRVICSGCFGPHYLQAGKEILILHRDLFSSRATGRVNFVAADDEIFIIADEIDLEFI